MNKIAFASAALLLIAPTEAGFMDHLHKMKDHHISLMQSDDSDNASLEPLVGRNLVSVILTDIVNVFVDPSWTTLMASFVDLSSFFMLPMMGGYVNATVFHNYEKDPLTY